MKTALVILSSADGATGKVVSGLIPYDEAVAKAREIAKGEQADPSFPVVEVWSGAVRRFAITVPAKPTVEPPAEPTAEPAKESTAKSK